MLALWPFLSVNPSTAHTIHRVVRCGDRRLLHGAIARERIGDYISMYNGRRPHDALGGKTPNMAYDGHGAQAAA